MGDQPLAVQASRTDGCPLGSRCESCGTAGPGLRVDLQTVLGGVFCLTMCPKCAGQLPAIKVTTLISFVDQHAEHLARGDGLAERRVIKTRRLRP
jgi:hypothetical protein